MATANTARLGERQPSRWKRNLVLLALVVAAGVAAFFWSRMRESAQARAAYAAQTGCLCRFVSGRGMAACQADPGVAQEWVRLTENVEERSVTAGMPLLAEQTSRWSAQGGCMLAPWVD